MMLDRGWERPAFYTDSITKQMKEGYFPIYVSEYDSINALVQPLWNIVKLGMKRTYLNSEDFKTEHINFKIANIQGSYGGKYDIDVVSNTDEGKVTLRLSNSQLDDYKNKYLLHAFIRYLNATKKDKDKNKIMFKSTL